MTKFQFWKRSIGWCFLVIAMSPSLTWAQDDATFDLRLSASEAYVGQSIDLILSLNNGDLDQPITFPNIDGLEIDPTPSISQQSSVLIVGNGQQRVRRAVTRRYRVTPFADGTFTIPSLQISIDGRRVITESMSLTAKISETGDLLDVRVSGNSQQVFVGQTLQLTLTIWVQPFEDEARGIRLSPADMWQCLSENCRWGIFEDAITQTRQNRELPGGALVRRLGEDGQSAEYYEFELVSTVTPIKVGGLDASDIQIVMEYPVELQNRRDPMADFFGSSIFGNRSPFGGSRDALVIAKTRPIVALVKVDETTIKPIPLEGRPANFRGAVGSFDIETNAPKQTVEVDEPVTLTIAISGDGELDGVQLPQLSDDPNWRQHFQITSSLAAGFVRNQTKFFNVTVQAKNEKVDQIPPVAFSYFDPESETFQTVKSEPIALEVTAGETLSLSDVVTSNGSVADPVASDDPVAAEGAQAHSDTAEPTMQLQVVDAVDLPDALLVRSLRAKGDELQINAFEKLRSRTALKRTALGFLLVWLAMLLGIARKRLLEMWRRRRIDAWAVQELNHANNAITFRHVVASYLKRRLRNASHPNDSIAIAGELRRCGHYELASTFESLDHKWTTFDSMGHDNRDQSFAETQHVTGRASHSDELVKLQESSGRLIRDIETAVMSQARSGIRRAAAVLALLVTLTMGHTADADDRKKITQDERNLAQVAADSYGKAIQTPSDSQQLISSLHYHHRLVQRGYGNANAWTQIGNLHWANGNPVVAIAAFRQALTEDPFNLAASKNSSIVSRQLDLETGIRQPDRLVRFIASW
ncbi:MAG: BatD family protein, partial [Planctomycetota bacterium]